MATHSVEWNAEELVALKLQQDARFAGQEFRHHEKDGKAATDVFILKAEKGERQLGGVKGWAVKIGITFSSGTLSAAEADTLALAVGEAIFAEDPSFAPDLPDIMFASLEEPETTTERTDTAKLRVRVVTVSAIIRITETIEEPVNFDSETLTFDSTTLTFDHA